MGIFPSLSDLAKAAPFIAAAEEDAKRAAKTAKREQLALYCVLLKLVDILPDDLKEEFYKEAVNVEEDVFIICDKAEQLAEEFNHYVY